ncbi:MAG: hypothetical protein KatS3mg125_1342 [Lysobacterales bacterium]|nr:MAG: hypothetical protein KatS3mg125_1342 [Xanthomonadales bacterium]
MDGPGKVFGEHGVDLAMALERASPAEAGTHDLEAKMQPGAATRMVTMAQGLVLEAQAFGREGLAQTACDRGDQGLRILWHGRGRWETGWIVPQNPAMS